MMEAAQVYTWMAISAMMLGGGLWLGVLSQRVKTLEEKSKEEPTLQQIHTDLVELKTAFAAFKENFKPANTRTRNNG